MVKAYTIGCKDMTKSIYTVWDQIFHPQHKKRAFRDRLAQSFGSVNSESNTVSPLHHLNDLILSHGNIDSIIEGCHEHYLHMRYLDTYMKKVSLNIIFLNYFKILTY